MVKDKSSRAAPVTVGHIESKVQYLIQSSLAKATRASYLRTWHLFFTFAKYSSSMSNLPLNTSVVANFIGFLFINNYKPSTIATHVSALSFVHKILDIPDPTAVFLIKKLLKGCEKSEPSVDSRLPITKDILYKLISSLPSICTSNMNQILLKTVFLLAFHGFF